MRYRITLQSKDPERHLTPQTMDLLDVSRCLELSSRLLRKHVGHKPELLFSAIMDDCSNLLSSSTSPDVEAAANRLYFHLAGKERAPKLPDWQESGLGQFSGFCTKQGYTASFAVPDQEPVLFEPRVEREWLPYQAPASVNALYRGFETRDDKLWLHLTINEEQLNCLYDGSVQQLVSIGAPSSKEKKVVVRCVCIVKRSRVSFRPISYVVKDVRTLKPFAEAKAQLRQFFQDHVLPHEDDAR